MYGVNKAILMGNLGADPEYLAPNGGKGGMCRLSVATSSKYKGEEKTEWHRVVLFGKPAEIAGSFLEKGSTVYLEGEIVTRQYEKDGEKRYSTEILVGAGGRINIIRGKRNTSGNGAEGEAITPGDELPF